MGMIHEEITLINAVDVGNVQRGYIGEQQVRRITVTAIVDTGAATLFITEAVRQTLGLNIQGERYTRTANGARVACEVTEPVEICWKERSTACRAIVIPGAENILLGAIPLEDMDLMVNPVKQTLEGVHGDEVISLAL
ncbi:MAG: retroviral-like aspartic protease family protein [Treponema sp.]|jgi:clan AA aspartic protease|nr:retroviral-like aspartic protease family protein [Treponema sp.]